MRRFAIGLAVSALALAGSTSTLAAQSQPAKTSYQLIDEALAAKRIDGETAHKYRVFAAFGDSRLPSEYRGANAAFELPPEIDEIGSLLETLSATTRAEVAPFFMRPEEPGSWIGLPTIGEPPSNPPGPQSDGVTNSVLGGRVHGSAAMLSARLVRAVSDDWRAAWRPREHSSPPNGWKTPG